MKEGRERVYAAIANLGYTFPLKRIAVKREAAARRLPQARASTLLSGYSMPTLLMSALKRGSWRRESKLGAGMSVASHSERSS